MNKNDFKNPLIQSGIVLLVVFLLISIVVGSESQGFLGSIGALISGLFSAVLFVIALVVAIVISIVILIAIYLGAVSFYSKEKGRNLYAQLKYSLTVYYRKVRGIDEPVPEPTQTVVPEEVESRETEAESELQQAETFAEPEPPVQPQAAPPTASHTAPAAAQQVADLEARLDDLSARIGDYAKTAAAAADKIAALEQRVEDLTAAAPPETKVVEEEHEHQQLDTQIQEIRSLIDKNSGLVTNLEQQVTHELGAIKEELASLDQKASVPEVISGILSYIDKPEDRDLITEKAKEGISRGMTYAQIDDFFQSSLSAEVYKELAAHPRLTKDFLRSIKKKF